MLSIRNNDSACFPPCYGGICHFDPSVGIGSTDFRPATRGGSIVKAKAIAVKGVAKIVSNPRLDAKC
jgi:hypothetical protein